MTEFDMVFIDTSPYIYYLEQHDIYYEKVADFLEKCYRSGKLFVTSTITIEEYSIGPYRSGDIALLNDFRAFLADTQTKILDITAQIADKAAQIRANFPGFKAMDALQLAASVVSGCDIFLTNDKQLIQFPEITCFMIDDL